MRRAATALAAALAFLAAGMPADDAEAAPPLLSQFCKSGAGAGQCSVPQGIATDPLSGDLYVVDNGRIDVFSAWGAFLRAFGGGVVSGGAQGSGTASPGSTTVTAATTTSKDFRKGMAIEATGIAPGTTIAAIAAGTLTLSQPATGAATGAPTALSSPEAPGNVPVNELQRLTVTATGGTFNLGFETREPTISSQTTTANIPHNAGAAEVQTALEALTNIGPGNVAVSSPNPGGEAGVPGGPYTVEFKGARFADTDVKALAPAAGSPPLSGGTATVAPIRQGASSPEVCTGVDCVAGVDGGGPGQLADARAVTVDSEGGVYVYESVGCTGGVSCDETLHNNRVQKFDSAGDFLLMFGGGVNQGGGTPANPGDLCTAQHVADGDVCAGGTKGDGDGEFGLGPNSTLDPNGSYTATGPGNLLYVGGKERIQAFDSDGNFLESIPLPGETVTSLAVDNDPASPHHGDLYVAYYLEKPSGLKVKEDVRRLDADTGAVLDTLAVPAPQAVAAGPAGHVYVFNNKVEALQLQSEVFEFDQMGAQVDGFGKGLFSDSIGLAAGSACGIDGADVFVANRKQADPFVALYGPIPDPEICPPPEIAPSIEAQFAISADSVGAILKAKINPHFWPDTRYYVQYGTGKCSSGGCEGTQPAPPGALLTEDAVDAGVSTSEVFLSGLEPNTAYRYRFVAESGGGGPVLGEERGFHTLPLASEGSGSCSNQAFRGGPSAKLPDCRAYELVSPLDKNNGDVVTPDLNTNFGQAAVDGERMTFSSSRAFGGAEGAPLTSQYLAERHAGEGWTSQSISPPRSALPLYTQGGTLTLSLFKAFSADLCSGWVLQDSDLALAPGAPEHVPNLYRHDNCGGGGYELLTTTSPPGFGLAGGGASSLYRPEIQGFSADGSRSVFRADASLAVAEGGPRAPFVCSTESKAETISYQWYRNGIQIGGATEPTYTPAEADEGTAIQCEVRASGGGAASTALSETSLVAPLGEVSPPDPGIPPGPGSGLPAAPSLAGIPAPGQTLTCTPGTWKGSPTFAYEWLRGGMPIGGASADEYTVQAADKGAAVQCRTIATNAAGSALADSVPVVVAAEPPTASATPTISGTPEVGQTLTCNPGTWAGAPTFAYQWLRNGANVIGATAATRTLAGADAGKAIQCRVTASNADSSAQGTSDRVVVPVAPATTPPQLTAPGAVTGTAQVGKTTLTCSPGTWSGSPTFAFKWLRNGSPIAGATEATYKLEAADVAKTIQCQVTATNAGASVVAIDASPGGARYVDPNPPPASASAISPFGLYVSAGTGQLRLVSVLPDGSPTVTNTSVGTKIGGAGDFREDSVYHAVSEDGSRVFWTATESGPLAILGGGNAQGPGKLYLRLNATEPQSEVSGGQCTEAAKACTVTVSESPLTEFVSADAEGTRVLYTVGIEDEDLYEAEIEEVGGQQVATSQPIASGVDGVMGASDDAGRVYLVSTEALSGGQENSEGQAAVAGRPNLYLYEVGGGVTFVARLAAEDVEGIHAGGNTPLSPLSISPSLRTSRVTPDGLHSAFTSAAPLTGYDNTDLGSEQPAAEVFLFDAAARGGEGELWCASCNPSGARPVGRNIGRESAPLWSAAVLPGWNSQSQPSRLLSDDGKRLFFNAFDALAPGDTNGKADVYQWEAPGEGDCTEESSAFGEANGGCLSPISSGQSATDSEIYDATPSGSDVFFSTQSSLVSHDYGLTDVYDARVNGGLPGPPAQPAACEGEACQGSAAAPDEQTPASSAFEGPGNLRRAAARCRKGERRVRKAGKARCVKKQSKRAHKRHHHKR